MAIDGTAFLWVTPYVLPLSASLRALARGAFFYLSLCAGSVNLVILCRVRVLLKFLHSVPPTATPLFSSDTNYSRHREKYLGGYYLVEMAGRHYDRDFQHHSKGKVQAPDISSVLTTRLFL